MRWARGLGATIALVLLGGLGGCGKKPVENRAIEWVTQVEVAQARASLDAQPVVVFVGAEWDTGSKEMDVATFSDPDVRALSKRYVMLRLDATDDEDLTYRRNADRFDVKGTPSLIIYAPDMKTELHRVSSFTPPQELASILMYADAPKSGLGDVRARASYEALRGVIDGVRERALGHELMEPKRTTPWVNCYGEPEAEQPACLREEEAHRAVSNAEHERLEKVVLPALLEDTPVLTMELRRSRGYEAKWAMTGPRLPKQLLGTRNAEVGIALDARTTLGWGTYRTNDNATHSGIEVVYQTGDDYAKMIVLTDGFRRPR